MSSHRRQRRLVLPLALVIGCAVAVGATALAVTGHGRLQPAGTRGLGDTAAGADHHAHAGAGPSISPGVPASRVLRGSLSFANGFTVPAGQVWEFASDVSTAVTSRANIVVLGVLRVRPANPGVVHTLRFTGIDERRFVGGGMRVLASDVGLWVMDAGQLDIAGSPKAGWNRTGAGAGWRAGDDIRVAPTGKGDSTTFARFTQGSAVPAVSHAGKTYRSEVFNLTRNVRIEGTGDGNANPATNGRAHVFIMSSRPQSIRYAELRHLAPRKADGQFTKGVLGRYGLHFHMMRDASKGSLVEGVVVRDSGGHAFVPHASNGITFRDTISFNTFEDAYWWDPDDTVHGGPYNATNGVRYEHAMAALARWDPMYNGYTLTGFRLGEGFNNSVVDSVGVGIQGNVGASGFKWTKGPNPQLDANIWTFTNNVAHNNRADGIFTWQNNGPVHPVRGFVGYRNGDFGVDHGSYVNSFQYSNMVLFENGSGGLASRAGGPDRTQVWRSIDTDSIRLLEHSVVTDWVIFDGVTLRGKIFVDESSPANNGHTTYEFRNVRMTGGREVTRADFVVLRQVSRIVVFRADGTSFEVRA